MKKEQKEIEKFRVYKVGYDGSFFITTHFEDVKATIEDSEEEYTIISFKMTQEEYEELPEFEGF
ncbi:hypothetical protein [Aquimarina sp. AU119]|uniref:hypothetical protein n=1 Tax=Aquimarina sp. AU119 TaxID=2108528 RepID=UPI000D691421|nr:hypothetical protein [Aquimarina sp. AU119]